MSNTGDDGSWTPQHDPFAPQDPSGRQAPGAGQDPYAAPSGGQDPWAQPPAGQPAPGQGAQDPFAAPAGQDSFGQAAAPAGQQDPYGQQGSYG